MSTRNSKSDMEALGRKTSAEANDHWNEHYRKSLSGGGGGGSCFTPCTRVLTPQGWRAIGTLEVGQEIVSLDGSDTVSDERILAVKTKRRGRIYEIQYHDAPRPIRVSWCHPFLTDRGWKMTVQLRPGDALHALGGSRTMASNRIDQVQRTDDREDLFTLNTTGPRTFVVEGSIVHNYSHLKALRGWLAERRYAHVLEAQCSGVLSLAQ